MPKVKAFAFSRYKKTPDTGEFLSHHCIHRNRCGMKWAFFRYFFLRSSQVNKMGLATYNDEYVPMITPTMRAKAKS